MLLLIADISGYTRYLWTHRETLAHAQVVINELMRALTTCAEPPLEIAKLEGDAIFFYVPIISALSDTWLPRKLDVLLASFEARQRVLYWENLCHCDACVDIEKLRLKLIVHSGRVLISQIGRFMELSGPDVILVHRLTKNSIRSQEYLLVTEMAYRQMNFSDDKKFVRIDECYPVLGKIAAFMYQFPPLPDFQACGRHSWWYRFGREWIKYFKALPYRIGLKRITFSSKSDADESVL